MATFRNAISLILLTILSQATGVILASFSASYISGSIQVDWETTSEHNIMFFRLERSTQSGSGFEAIYDYIPAEGDDQNGWFYGVVDDEVTFGTTYYYRLVAVDTDEIETYYGPIAVNAGNNPIPTTIAPTATATASPTRPTSTPTQLLFATQTNTAEPVDTSAVTHTPEGATTPSPTAPPDTIPTLEYTLESSPTDTPTEIPSPTASIPLPTPAPAQPEAAQNPLQLNLLIRIALLSVVFGVWAVLAVGGYLYILKNFP